MTYRNREIKIVKNCLESLDSQKNKDFDVVLVDYGSTSNYKKELGVLVEQYPFVRLIRCETQQQLWCKSKAINIALKTIETSYCFIGDVDMLYHPEFITVLEKVSKERDATYFQVGFLSEKESKNIKTFRDYNIAFKSQKGATGMTLYNTALLKSIGGYDEFYNGWGSEDTDVHLRLQNAGHLVKFYSDKVMMLHQWHAKHYRMNNDYSPFHSALEQTNAAYLDLVASTNRIKANTDYKWGEYTAEDYEQLQHIDESYTITNRIGAVTAFINGVLLPTEDKVIQLKVIVHKDYKSFKQRIKKLLGKKTMAFDSMQAINDQLLECIIRNLRNQPYKYQYNRRDEIITVIIKL